MKPLREVRISLNALNPGYLYTLAKFRFGHVPRENLKSGPQAYNWCSWHKNYSLMRMIYRYLQLYVTHVWVLL